MMSSPTPPPSCEDSSGGDATPNKRQRTSLMRIDSSGATNVVEQEHAAMCASCKDEDSAIVLFDFTAAFPSIS